jgi:hypothetical protein
MEALLAAIEVLSFKIETNLLRRVLISWINKNGCIPNNTEEYAEIRKIFQDKTTIRILHERDLMNDVYFGVGEKDNMGDSKPRTSNTASQNKMDKDLLLDNKTKRKDSQSISFTFYSKINMLRAETKVLKNLLDVNMIKIATQMLDAEHGALCAAFD